MSLRAGVIGVGYLGSFHAEKYAQLSNVELVAVADTNARRAKTVAERWKTKSIADFRQLIGSIDCVSVAVPTALHFEITREMLANGIDVLVEKPMTQNVAEGRELVQLAERNGRILQVGHLERFNPAIRAVAGRHDRSDRRL